MADIITVNGAAVLVNGETVALSGTALSGRSMAPDTAEEAGRPEGSAVNEPDRRS